MTCPACDFGGYGQHTLNSPECKYHEAPESIGSIEELREAATALVQAVDDGADCYEARVEVGRIRDALARLSGAPHRNGPGFYDDPNDPDNR